MNEERRRLAAGIRRALALIPGTVNERSAAIGCSPPSLYRWQAGATRPSDRMIRKIAELSGLSVTAIHNGRND